MGIDKFDDVARGLASGASRRSLVRTLGAAVLGAGGILATSRGAQAGIEDILGDDEDEDKDDDLVCRPRCQRRCRRARQNCILSGRNPLRCRFDCEDRCCEERDGNNNRLPWLR
jgi:hypothetical protein